MIDHDNVERVLLNLQRRVDKVEKEIEKLKKRPDALFKEEWMDGQDVMLALHISLRTLQTLRDSGKLIPTRLLKKYYYKVADIKALLKENYISYHLKQNHTK